MITTILQANDTAYHVHEELPQKSQRLRIYAIYEAQQENEALYK